MATVTRAKASLTLGSAQTSSVHSCTRARVSRASPSAPPAVKTVCAVPKKKKSKHQTRKQKAKWFEKAYPEAERALSLAKAVLSGRSKSFYYPTKEEADQGSEPPAGGSEE